VPALGNEGRPQAASPASSRRNSQSTGTYGQLTLNTDGSWSYALDNTQGG